MSLTIETFFRSSEANSNQGDAAVATSKFAETFLMADSTGASVVQAQSLMAAIPQRKNCSRPSAALCGYLIGVKKDKSAKAMKGSSE
jgi:hypothetical protein